MQQVFITPVSEPQFDELCNRFGETVTRIGCKVRVTLSPYCGWNMQAELDGLAREHGYTVTPPERV